MPRWRIRESQEVDEQFEVRGGIGVVILLTSSDSEAPFEDNIGTYLSKRGGLAKPGSLIGLIAMTRRTFNFRLKFSLGVQFVFARQPRRDKVRGVRGLMFGCIRPLQMRRGSAALPPHVRGKHGCRDRYGGRRPDTTSGRLGTMGGNG